MKRLFIVIALTASGCDRLPRSDASAPAAAPTATREARSSAPKAPAVVPMPADQAEIDRLILAGYTPHGKHLDPPGARGCPLAQGNKAVM